MVEPENHTLRMLRDIREAVRALDQKVDRNHTELKEQIDYLTQALAGEMAARTYVGGALEQRLAEIERRLSTLEEIP